MFADLRGQEMFNYRRLDHNDSIKNADINEECIFTMMNDEIRIFDRNTWKLLRVLCGLHWYDDITFSLH